MIVNDNELTEKGDVLIFKTIPIFNLQNLSGVVFNTTGETLNRYFSYKFSFSVDGIVYTDWIDYNSLPDLLNAINPILNNKTVLTVKFWCERSGSDLTGSLILDGIDLNGVYLPYTPDFQNSLKSIFEEQKYDDVDVWNYMVNLSQKIYESGILPTYIERNEKPNNIKEDEDFIAYWTSIAQFFALNYIYSIKFTIIFWRKELLCEYLKQRNVIFCECSDIITLQTIAKNLFDEFRQRGTIEIFKTKDYEYPIGYRKIFQLPVGFVIQPSNPIWINGIKYTEFQDLPFGVQIDGLQLIMYDINYYLVQIADWGLTPPIITADYEDIVDTLPKITIISTTQKTPTQKSKIFRKYNGEYLRLICFCNKCDWFCFNLINKQNRGWNIRNASPLYKGLRQHNNITLITGYENYSAEVWDLDRYPILDLASTTPPPPTETFLIKTSNTDLLDANEPNTILTHVPYQ